MKCLLCLAAALGVLASCSGRRQAEAVETARQGADFCFVTRGGDTARLADFREPLRILLFYDPECETCMEKVAELHANPVYNELAAQHYLRIIAVSPATDTERWRSGAAFMPPEWTVGIDTADIVDELYLIPALPSLRLLDAGGNIILTDPDPEELLREILRRT